MWTGAKYPRGYGHAVFMNRHMGAHRASWILATAFFIHASASAITATTLDAFVLIISSLEQ
jgi:hypothetical protein